MSDSNLITFFLRTAPVWVIPQRIVVISYRRFGTTYLSLPQGSKIQILEFYVLLTVHLCIILVNDQLDAQFFFYMFISVFYMFRATLCSSWGNQLYQYNVWYVSLCVIDRLVCRSGRNFLTCILDRHLHRVTHTRYIDTIVSPDDEHKVTRNM
jgi:hypothetical protein